MLERRGVEDDLRPEPFEDLADAARVPDVREHGLLGVEQGTAVQRELYLVQGGLVPVEQN